MPSTLMRNPELAASANTIDEMINDSLLRLYTFRKWVEVPIAANMVSLFIISFPGYLPIHPTGDARICLPKECAYVRPVSELPSV